MLVDPAEDEIRVRKAVGGFGGELKKLGSTEFRDLEALDIVGIYPNYRTAQAAWKAKAQASVDNAHMRYFVVHLHRLLEPDGKGSGSE